MKQSFASMLVFLSLMAAVSVLLAPWAQAQVFVGSTAAALGGAGRAGAEGSESLFFNPAVLAHTRKVEVGAFLSTGELGKGTKQDSLAFSVLDGNADLLIPGAVNYLSRRRGLLSGALIEEELWQVSVGQFIWPRWALGLSILRLQQDFTVWPESLSSGLPGRTVQWNGNLGVLFTPKSDLGLAWTYHNFIPTSSSVAEELKLLPQMGLGLNYLMTDFLRLRLDLTQYLQHNPQGKVDIATGLESFWGEFVALRLGARWEQSQSRQFLTAGLGFIGPRFLANYSYQSRSATDSTMHGVDLRLAF